MEPARARSSGSPGGKTLPTAGTGARAVRVARAARARARAFLKAELPRPGGVMEGGAPGPTDPNTT